VKKPRKKFTLPSRLLAASTLKKMQSHIKSNRNRESQYYWKRQLQLLNQQRSLFSNTNSQHQPDWHIKPVYFNINLRGQNLHVTQKVTASVVFADKNITLELKRDVSVVFLKRGQCTCVWTIRQSWVLHWCALLVVPLLYRRVIKTYTWSSLLNFSLTLGETMGNAWNNCDISFFMLKFHLFIHLWYLALDCKRWNCSFMFD